MIVRFFKTGISNGESPVRYVLSNKDHQSRDRHEPPEILLDGDPRLTIDLINGINRKYKYASGCIAFRPEEQPNKQTIEKILRQFLCAVSPGLEPDQVNSFFVLHKDKPDQAGKAGSHVHFILPMVILSGQQAGNRWNPHPPGSKTIEKMEAFTKVINHEHGWNQVLEKPTRIGVNSFWRKVDGQANGRKLGILQDYLTTQIKNGALKNRDELINYIENELGCPVTRKGDSYISVRLPHFKKSVRLRGKLFEAKSDYAREFSTHSPNARTMSKLTVHEYTEAKTRLEQLINGQAANESGLVSISAHTKQKEKNTNGRVKRIGAGTKFGASSKTEPPSLHYGPPLQPVRPAHSHAVTNPKEARQDRTGLSGQLPISVGETSRFGNGARRRFTRGIREGQQPSKPTNESGTRRTTQAIPNANPSPNLQQHSGNKKQGTPRPTATIPTTLFRVGSSAEEINDQLRQLGMALSYASYEEQGAIQQQICQLVGRRENLPKPR